MEWQNPQFLLYPTAQNAPPRCLVPPTSPKPNERAHPLLPSPDAVNVQRPGGSEAGNKRRCAGGCGPGQRLRKTAMASFLTWKATTQGDDLVGGGGCIYCAACAPCVRSGQLDPSRIPCLSYTSQSTPRPSFAWLRQSADTARGSRAREHSVSTLKYMRAAVFPPASFFFPVLFLVHFLFLRI